MNPILYALATAAMAVSQASLPKADGNPIDVRVNGAVVRFDSVQPMVWYTRILVPVKDVVDELGGSTRWNSRTNSLRVRVANRTAFLKIGSQVASMDDRDIWLDVAPRTVRGTTMVPLNFFSEAFGANTRWNAGARMVTIDMSNRRRSATTTASLEEDRGRNVTDQQFDGDNDTDARRQYRSQFGAGDSKLTADYDRFLVEQDFRRYQNDKGRWIQDYQNYLSGRMTDGSRGNFVPSRNYAQYLRDRDFEMFSNNLAGWRGSYQRFMQWRRTMSAAQSTPAYQQYLQDRQALSAQTEQLLREGSTNAIPGTGKGSTPGTGTFPPP